MHFTVDVILQEWIAGINTIRDDFIKGLYLTGSIPLSDFHPGKSDIDFVILCDELPRNDFRLKLESVHKLIERKFKTTKLSGTYLTRESLQVQNLQTTKTLSYHEGRMREITFEMGPVTLFELKTKATTLLGIPAENLPIIVEIDDVKKFLLGNINTYWKNWADQYSSMRRRQVLLILFPRLTEWVILGLARQLYTLQTGQITSKTDAGHYCLRHLPDPYHHIIQAAIKIRNDKSRHFLNVKTSYYVQPSVRRSHETITCARYIMQQCLSSH